jgi:hypothetical protein
MDVKPAAHLWDFVEFCGDRIIDMKVLGLPAVMRQILPMNSHYQ